MFRESEPLSLAGGDAVTRLFSPNLPAALPLSTLSQRNLLAECHRAFTDVLNVNLVLAPAGERQAAAGRCLQWAGQATTETANFSFAWYVMALAAAEQGEWEQFNQALIRSRQSGPFEQWIAEYRVDLAESNYHKLTREALAEHDSDLAVLVASSQGVRSIADRYVADPRFRDRIANILDKEPIELQQRFLTYLNRRAK